MKLQYFIPALLVSICVACPGKDAMGYDFGEFFSNPHGAEGRRKLYQAVNAPYCQSTCGATVVPTAAKTCSAYSQVKSMADSYFDSTQSVFDLSNAFGAIVRLAFHDAAEVDITDDDILGPDGCLSTDDGNSGLVESGSFVATSVEYAWQQVCDRITRADFWVMLGKIAVERSEPTGTIVMDYQYGRKDANYWTGCSVYGRLPGAEGDVDDFYQVFVTQMGMNLNDAATLLGAHTVGHSHPSISGYGMSTSYPNNGYFNGFDDTPHIFDNNYYYNLHTANWYSATAPANGNLINFLSTVYPQTCMLPADISSGYIRTGYSTFQTQTCGPYAVGTSNPKSYGCTPSSTIMPLTCWQSCNHGNSNSYFLQEFRKSWNKMTCAGYGVPANTAGASASGKLGTLYYLDLDTCSA